MAVYQPATFDVDWDAVRQRIIALGQALIPGLRFDAGTTEDMAARIATTISVEALQLLQENDQASYSAFGEKILRIPRQGATYASTTVTILADDTVGHTIDAGEQLTLADSDGNRKTFYFPAGATIDPGVDTVAGVTIVAVDPGLDGTGLSLDPVLEQPRSWMVDITADAATTGGNDGETDDEFVDKVADEGLLLTRTLVTAEDFAIDARNQPGIGRALAIDLYDADTSTPGVGGHITVAVTADDGSGANASTQDKSALQAHQDEQSVADLTNHVINPTRTSIAVVFAGKCRPEYAAADVETQSEQAVLDFLDPNRWGIPDIEGPVSALEWEDTPIVRYQDIVTVLNNVPGFAYYTSLTVNGGTADITMTGPAALPTPSAAGTVTSP
jgi:hypothetical protein